MAINLDHQRDKLSTTSQFLTLSTTGALILPSGTTAEATATTVGQIRYNVDTGKQHIEQYVNGSWNPVSSKEKLEELDDVTLYTYGFGSEYIKYSPSIGFVNTALKLTELNDVSIPSTVISGQVLKYDSSNTFKPYTLELTDLSDVTILGTPAQDKILKTNVNGVFELADPYTNASFDTRFSSKDTDNLGEGTTNLYFTNERVDDRVNALFIDGSGFQTVYDDAQNKLTASVTLSAFTTSNLSEGSNLYYTNARADARIALINLTDLTDVDTATNVDDGKFLKYNHSGSKFEWSVVPAAYTSAHFNADFNAKDTDNLSEGTTNLYYTAAKFDTRFAIKSLRNLNDVSISTPSDGQVLKWNANGYWEAGTDTALTIGTGAGQAMAGNTALYSTTDFTTDFNTKTTNNLSEGTTNKYATNVNIRVAISATSPIIYNTTSGAIGWNGDTDDVPQGTTNKYYSSTLFDTDLATKDTDNVAEGSNLYFTNGRADARIALASLPDLADVDTVSASKDNFVLTYDHSNTKFEWLKPYDSADFNTDLATTDTDNVAEGTTNLYYTDTRADTRIGLATIEDLYDVDITNRVDGMLLKWSSGTSRWIMGSDAGTTGGGSVGVGNFTGLEDTNLGDPGAAQDGLQVVWNNYTSKFIFSEGIQAAGPTQIVTVADGKFYLNGNLQQTLRIYKGFLYVFNQTDSTNVGNELYISTSSTGGASGVGEYTDGVSTSGNVGSTFQLLFNVPMDAPVQLYYQSKSTASMGGILNIDVEGGNAYQTIAVTDTGTGSSSGADIIAASSNDTLTVIAGNNVSIVTSQSGTDDQLTISATGATGTTSTLGTPADTTFHDGAFLQKNQTFNTGTPLTGFNTAGTITEAFDAVNEVMLNIRNDSFVRHATFTATPVVGNAPLDVVFTTTSDYNANSYEWDFGDGNTITTADASYTHTYTTFAGSPFDVELKAIATGANSLGSEGSYAVFKRDSYVRVYAPSPIPKVVCATHDADTGTTIRHTVSTTQYADTYMIEFGDGTKYPIGAVSTDPLGTGSNTAWADITSIPPATVYVDHTWTTASDFAYDFDLYVWAPAAGTSGEIGHLDNDDHIRIYVLPVPTFTSTPTTGNSNAPEDNLAAGHSSTEGWRVVFTNTTSNMGEFSNTTYTWDWGDIKTTVTGIILATAVEEVVTVPSTITVADGSIFSDSDQILFRDVAGTTQINGKKIYVGVNGNTLTLYNQSELTSYYNNSTWSAYTSGGTATSSFYQITDDGSNVAGTPGNVIEHFYKHTTNTGVDEIFTCKLYVDNGYSSAPISDAKTITVKADPRASYTGETVHDSTGHTNYDSQQIGFEFTGYDGENYSFITFNNTSVNTDTWAWDLGDNTTFANQHILHHDYAQGTFSVTLEATGPTSVATGSVPGRDTNFVDDTETKTSYIEIKAAPVAPSNLSGKTMGLTSVGTAPKLASDTTNNTTTTLTAGADVVRVTNSTVQLDELSDHVNKIASNGTNTATLTAIINGAGDGVIQLNATDQTNVTNGSLTLTVDVDANTITTNKPTIPTNFYKVIKAQVEKISTPSGYNEIKLTHSDGSSSDTTEFVYDNITSTPTIAGTWILTESIAGSKRIMSSVPFYNSSGELAISGITVANLTGETYRNDGKVKIEPLTWGNSTADNAFTQQLYSFTNIGLTSPPPKNVGVSTPQSLSNLGISLSGGSTQGVGYARIFAENCNGEGTKVESTQPIHFWHADPTLDELSIPITMDHGSAVIGAIVGKRIDYSWTGDTPNYSSNASNDFYTTYAWNNLSTIINRTEAVCYLNEIKHMLTDFSDYLPAGPNLSTGRGNATQYFTFGFKRDSANKFAIKISGEVTSLYIAIPGYDTDLTSSLNGWLDCSTLFGGSGFPGANTSAGGNGSNGVRKTGTPEDQGNFAINTDETDAVANLELGEANTGDSTNKVILVRFGIAVNNKVTSISIEDV